MLSYQPDGSCISQQGRMNNWKIHASLYQHLIYVYDSVTTSCIIKAVLRGNRVIFCGASLSPLIAALQQLAKTCTNAQNELTASPQQFPTPITAAKIAAAKITTTASITASKIAATASIAAAASIAATASVAQTTAIMTTVDVDASRRMRVAGETSIPAAVGTSFADTPPKFSTLILILLCGGERPGKCLALGTHGAKGGKQHKRGKQQT